MFPAGFWSQILGIIVVQGPGGFTSLRIGIATANAMAWALQIPIIGVESNIKSLVISDKEIRESDEKLIKSGLKKIKKIKKFRQVLPKYGREPNITMKK